MKLLFLSTLISLLGFSTTLAQANEGNMEQGRSDVVNVSIISLIATPEKYHGKKVRVIGYFQYDEAYLRNIFLHKEDSEKSILKNSFWIFFPKGISGDSVERYKGYNQQYVILEGIFDMHNQGPSSLFSGAIKEVTRLELWDKIKHLK
jgi:hypothetical protein